MSDRMSALGFLETPFLSVACLVADTMVKGSPVKLLGFESTGDLSLMIRIAGDPAAVGAALVEGERAAATFGVETATSRLARPEKELQSLTEFPNVVHPIYGGREQFLPSDHNHRDTAMAQTKQQALGILETQGLTAILEATDAMLKSADVELVGKEKIGAAYVTVMVRGDVAAVKAALEAGKHAVEGVGKLIAAEVIARPHADLAKLLP